MVEELATGDCIALIPKPAEIIFDAPGSAGPQLLFLQCIQFLLTFMIELLGIERKMVTHPLESIIAFLHQLAMFFTPHLVDAFVEMLRNVKAIKKISACGA